MIYHNAWDSIIGDACHGLSGFHRRCWVAKSADGCAIAAWRTEEVDSPAHIVRPARSAGDMTTRSSTNSRSTIRRRLRAPGKVKYRLRRHQGRSMSVRVTRELFDGEHPQRRTWRGKSRGRGHEVNCETLRKGSDESKNRDFTFWSRSLVRARPPLRNVRSLSGVGDQSVGVSTNEVTRRSPVSVGEAGLLSIRYDNLSLIAMSICDSLSP
jgi:hypothetical protein